MQAEEPNPVQLLFERVLKGANNTSSADATQQPLDSQQLAAAHRERARLQHELSRGQPIEHNMVLHLGHLLGLSFLPQRRQGQQLMPPQNRRQQPDGEPAAPNGLPAVDVPAGLPQLPASLSQLQLPNGVPQLPTGLPQLPNGLPQLPNGLPQLPTGLPQLPAGLPQLPAGLPQLSGLPQLPAGLRLPRRLPRLSDLPHPQQLAQQASATVWSLLQPGKCAGLLSTLTVVEGALPGLPGVGGLSLGGFTGLTQEGFLDLGKHTSVDYSLSLHPTAGVAAEMELCSSLPTLPRTGRISVRHKVALMASERRLRHTSVVSAPVLRGAGLLRLQAQQHPTRPGDTLTVELANASRSSGGAGTSSSSGEGDGGSSSSSSSVECAAGSTAVQQPGSGGTASSSSGLGGDGPVASLHSSGGGAAALSASAATSRLRTSSRQRAGASSDSEDDEPSSSSSSSSIAGGGGVLGAGPRRGLRLPQLKLELPPGPRRLADLTCQWRQAWTQRVTSALAYSAPARQLTLEYRQRLGPAWHAGGQLMVRSPKHGGSGGEGGGGARVHKAAAKLVYKLRRQGQRSRQHVHFEASYSAAGGALHVLKYSIGSRSDYEQQKGHLSASLRCRPGARRLDLLLDAFAPL